MPVEIHVYRDEILNHFKTTSRLRHKVEWHLDGGAHRVSFRHSAVLARLLSPADFGLMGMIMVVFGFAQAFADMGISNAIIHHQDVTLV